MPYHAIKTSVLSGAVPTDGVMYYVGGGKWSNQYDDRKLFDTEDAARDEITITHSTGVSYLPKGSQFVSE